MDDDTEQDRPTVSLVKPTTGAEPAPVVVAGRRWGFAVLAVVAALLVGAGVTMTVLYVQQRDRAAHQAAERRKVEADLAVTRAREAELQGKLADAQSRSFDPAGYEKIQSCVRFGAAITQPPVLPPGAQRVEVTAGPNGTFVGTLPDGTRITVAGPGDFAAPAQNSPCTEAVKYLR
jgi:hypothetical protein